MLVSLLSRLRSSCPGGLPARVHHDTSDSQKKKALTLGIDSLVVVVVVVFDTTFRKRVYVTTPED